MTTKVSDPSIEMVAVLFLLAGELYSPHMIARAQPQNERTQPMQAALPAFDVASVRPSDPNERLLNTFATYPGGRIVAKGCTLKSLVMIAFNIREFQISGGREWVGFDQRKRFDIQAKPPDSSLSAQWKTTSPKIAPGPEEREMLQSLLADRFHLAIHRETKEGPVYILSRASGYLRLNPPKDKNEYPWAGGIGGGLPDGDGMRGMNISMPELAARMSTWLDRPVIDKTGIHGSFDFEFHSGEGDPNSSTDVVDSILTSIKAIGLNLQSSRAPIETVVVDYVEEPSPN